MSLSSLRIPAAAPAEPIKPMPVVAAAPSAMPRELATYEAPSPVPQAPASARYENAFRSWSNPDLVPFVQPEDPDASQGPLTYAVYTAEECRVALRTAPGARPAPVAPTTGLATRVGITILGACFVLGTAAAVLLAMSDDAPEAPHRSIAAALPPPAPVSEPVDDLEIEQAAAPAPTRPAFLVIEEAPAPVVRPAAKVAARASAPTPAPTPKAAVRTGSPVVATAPVRADGPPPNPYGK